MSPSTRILVRFFSWGVAGALTVGLFMVAYEVQDLEEQFADIGAAVAADRQAIHVLNAEWAHLNNPTRLRALADRHLALKPVTPGDLGAFSDLPLCSVGSETGSPGCWERSEGRK